MHQLNLNIVSLPVHTDPALGGSAHGGSAQEAAASLHQMSLLEVLEMARLQMRYMTSARHPPEIVIVGIEPQDVSIGTELSDCVQEKRNDLLAAVLEEVAC